MNEQLQQALVDIINKAIGGIDASIGFLSAEIPDVVHQVLMWYAVESALKCLLCLVCFAVAAYGSLKLVKFVLREPSINGYEGASILFILACVWGFVGVPLLCMGFSLAWLKIWIAPKLWLIEYATSIVK